MRPHTLAPLGCALVIFVACTTQTGTDSSNTGGSSSGSPAKTADPPQKGPQENTSSSSGSGGIPDNGPCTGSPGELYALDATPLGETKPVALCQFKGAVLMIVNTASFCGYTPQYEPLQTIHDKYKTKKFYVLGFPSKSFNQESDQDAEISKFCTENYKITFPMFTVGNVNAPNEQPVFTWLKSWPGQNDPKDIQWNFEKYLVSRAGQVVKRIMTDTTPDDPAVIAAIEAELAK